MGGDHAPEEAVKGALSAASLINGEILLVGIPEQIEEHLPHNRPDNIHIIPASEVVDMHEKPLEALRKKKDSSISVAAKLVKEGRADVFVSAGNTGACTAASLLSWRQVTGVKRPAIATIFPSHTSHFLLLDAGASPDVEPENLLEFAVMGRSYAEKVMGRKDPKVHLINIGEEPGKGNAFAKQAHDMLAGHDWFAGNIEGKDIFSKDCDVVVCDAFVGNVVLKTAEGVGEFIMGEFKAAVPSGPLKLFFLPIRKALAPLKKKFDYAEVGGSPLLGLNGICIICHGRSSAKAIHNAILQGAKSAEANLVNAIRTSIEEEHAGKNQ